MRSMTGQGHGEFSNASFRATVEVASVNRKQFEAILHIPKELDVLEAQLRELVSKSASRGRITLSVALTQMNGSSIGTPTINKTKLKGYLTEIQAIAQELGISNQVGMDTLLRLPGVMDAPDNPEALQEVWPTVQSAAEQALTAFVGMREREGSVLAMDLQARVETMRDSVSAIRQIAPGVVQRYREQLLEKIRALGATSVTHDDERLLKEIVIYTDRTDVSEELARLESHFIQFRDCLLSREPVGRTLDFLAQEMNREINTIGSKANDSAISKNVVALKTELERFREQAQNVE